jgi:hypothetical protein
MKNNIINIAVASCFALAITAALAGCRQEKRHEDVVNSQSSTTGGAASAPSGTSGSNSPGSSGN